MKHLGVITHFDMKKRCGTLQHGEDAYDFTIEDVAGYPHCFYADQEVTFRFYTLAGGGKAIHKVRSKRARRCGTVLFYESENILIIVDIAGKHYVCNKKHILHTTRNVKPGDKVEFDFKSYENGEARAINVVCDNACELEKFIAYFDYTKVMAELEDMAEPENWKFLNYETHNQFPLLLNYLKYAFEHAFLQDRIGYSTSTKGSVYAALNTGLLSRNGEEIYLIFSKVEEMGVKPMLKPYGWNYYKLTDNWTTVALQYSPMPTAARYYQKLNDVIFDDEKPIVARPWIIVERCKHLLPARLLKKYDEAELELKVLETIMKSLADMRKGKTVPVAKQYNNQIEFALPLHFEGEAICDIALVLTQYDGYYICAQIMTFENVYKNARQLGRVKNEWLKPLFAYRGFEMPLNSEMEFVPVYRGLF